MTLEEKKQKKKANILLNLRRKRSDFFARMWKDLNREWEEERSERLFFTFEEEQALLSLSLGSEETRLVSPMRGKEQEQQQHSVTQRWVYYASSLDNVRPTFSLFLFLAFSYFFLFIPFLYFLFTVLILKKKTFNQIIIGWQKN